MPFYRALNRKAYMHDQALYFRRSNQLLTDYTAPVVPVQDLGLTASAEPGPCGCGAHFKHCTLGMDVRQLSPLGRVCCALAGGATAHRSHEVCGS